MKKFMSFLLVLALTLTILPATLAASEPKYAISSVNGGTTTPEVSVGKNLTLGVSFTYLSGAPVPDEIIATLVTDASGSVYPFEIDQISYTKVIEKDEDDLYTYTAVLPTRAGSSSGYYNLTFKIEGYKASGTPDFVYLPEPEVLTLTVKVNAPPAPPPTPVPATPKVIISYFSTSSTPVTAGDRFSLYVTFKNTGSVPVNNLKAQFSSDGTFTTVSGSTTVFIDSIPAGGSVSRSVYLSTKSETVPGSYSATFALNYDVAGIAEPVVGTETISVPVSQPLKVQFTEMTVNPSDIFVGQDVNVMSSINNTGKSTIYNVSVSFAGSVGFAGANKYLGNIQSGSTGNIDLYITPEKEGPGKIMATIVFEDEQGVKTTKVLEREVNIMPKPAIEKPPVEEPTEPSGGLGWIFIVLAVALIGGVAALIILKKRKERLHKLSDLAEAEQLDEQLIIDDEVSVTYDNDGKDK